jgi:hypothetical protein
MDELFNTLWKRPDFGGSSLICLDFVRVLFLCREQLSQTGQAIGNLGVA